MTQPYQAILCPYCGHTQRNMDVCEACGGRFDPVSRRGVQINMGPWFLHDERVPFRPGFSFSAVLRLIAAGKLKPDSLLKGPTTGQLWQTARTVPGVAHRLGVCDKCSNPCASDGDSCEICGAAFAVPAEHNELNIAYHTPQQAAQAKATLDRAFELTRGKSKRLVLETHEAVGALTLCLYCGQWQKSDERCQSCGGLFDAYSLEATRIAMGPWFVRNKRFPYLPGCSYEVLRQQIDAGRIDSSTILRGPTTRQFWAVARNTPGVSHLVGFCFHCGGRAKATSAGCASCGTPFPLVGGQNLLGLALATEAEAQAAQKQLEAQYSLTAPPTPIAGPIPTSLPAAGGMHAALGAEALSGLDQASLAVLATPSQAPTSSNVTTPSAAAPWRRRKRLVLASAALAALAVGVILLIQGLSGGGARPGDALNPAVNPTPLQPTPSIAKTPAGIAGEMREVVRQAWNEMGTIDRDGMIGLMLENVGDLMRRADAMVDDGLFDKAIPLYEAAKKELTQIRARASLREDARVARFEAEAQMTLIASAMLPPDLQLEASNMQFLFDEGTIHFHDGNFEKAIESWKAVAVGTSALLRKITGTF